MTQYIETKKTPAEDLELAERIEAKSSPNGDLDMPRHIEAKSSSNGDLDMSRHIEAQTVSSIDMDILDISEDVHETTPLSVDYDRQHNIDMDGTTPRTRERVRCCFGRPLGRQHFVPTPLAVVVYFNICLFVC